MNEDFLNLFSEDSLEDMSSPCEETNIIIAQKENVDLVYAVQAYRFDNEYQDFYAIRMRNLGKFSFIPNRQEPNNIWGDVNKNSKYEKWHDAFHVIVNKKDKTVTFGPKGQIKISDSTHRNHGLASYAMSLVVRHIKQFYEEFSINPGSLSHVDAGSSNYDLRHFFYSGVGLEPDYVDDKGNGKFSANSVSCLKENINTDKIKEIGIDGMFTAYVTTTEELSDYKGKVSHFRDEIDRLRHQRIPAKNKVITALSIGLLLQGALIYFIW